MYLYLSDTQKYIILCQHLMGERSKTIEVYKTTTRTPPPLPPPIFFLDETLVGHVLYRALIIDGVPVLVSELHIVADQASTVTCASETIPSEDSVTFDISGTYYYYTYMHCMQTD